MFEKKIYKKIFFFKLLLLVKNIELDYYKAFLYSPYSRFRERERTFEVIYIYFKRFCIEEELILERENFFYIICYKNK